MEPIVLIGGMIAGFWRATAPFCMLTLSENSLALRFMFAYNYTFTPEQIIAIEPVGSIPYLSTGIRIHHNVLEYPENLVFFHFNQNSNTLLQNLNDRGFETINL